jgi:hypothetical protein
MRAGRLVLDRYDDGGVSGASLDRPALQQLLADVQAGKITIVVVYKVDRLTRSLADFAKLILEAWSFIHGPEPAPKNQRAAAAAELYWNVATGHIRIEPTKAALERIVGQEAKSWGERLNGWRHHFKQAKEPAASDIRQEIRRHLKEGKRQAGRFLGDEPD